jgi:hypothetical protein
MAGKTALPPIVGLIIVVIGVFDVVMFPRMLIRRWKKQDGAGQ